MLQYRRATDADANAFLTLETSIQKPWLYAPAITMRAALHSIRQSTMFIGSIGSADVASGVYQNKAEGAAYLCNISVHPDWQRRGIATDLITFLLKQVEDAAEVTLVVRPQNGAALGLYRRFGFVAGSIVINMCGDGEPRLNMTRANVAAPSSAPYGFQRPDLAKLGISRRESATAGRSPRYATKSDGRIGNAT